MVAKNILVEKMSYEVDYLGIVAHGFHISRSFSVRILTSQYAKLSTLHCLHLECWELIQG